MNYENEDVQLIIEELNEKIDKSINSYIKELMNLRVGRANIHILDGIMVDYYNTPTPINQISNITIPEARLLAISVWDISMMKKVEKAIIDANIGIIPTNDGKLIRLVFPEPNEERRRELIKELKSIGEKTKISVRNIRRHVIDEIKDMKKNSIITEDMQKSVEKDVDKSVSQKIDEIDIISQEKEKEIMKV